MPRKAYIADLNSVVKSSKSDHIREITSEGCDDGEFTFLFDGIEIRVLVPELSEYPDAHQYLIFAGEGAPPKLAAALQRFRPYSQTLSNLLSSLCKFLVDETRTGGKEDPFEIADSGDEEEDVFEDAADSSPDDEEMSEIEEDWGMDGDGYGTGSFESMNGASSNHAVNAKKARQDLRELKAAGFKVGVIGRGDSRQNFSGAVYISAAVRISKLGLSDDTLVAWAVKDKEHYLILMMYYPSGYRSLQELRDASSTTRKQLFSMRVATSEGYTAKVEDATALFKIDKENTGKISTTLKPTFISIPLEDLLNNNLLVIIEYRLKFGFNATSAEHYLKANLGQTSLVASFEDSYDFSAKHKEFITGKTSLLRGDELGEGKELSALSLPLIAAQFFLRHFVGCCKFCLVCFEPLQETFEALKPYVCSSPLCLYQFQSLGLGPDLSHEILHQPMTTDALVSFAYTSVKMQMLEDSLIPSGLALSVPHPGQQYHEWSGEPQPGHVGYLHQHQPTSTKPTAAPSAPSRAKVDFAALELLFEDGRGACPLRIGAWVVINVEKHPARHCRITETCYYPTIKIAEPIIAAVDNKDKHKENLATIRNTATIPGWHDATFHIYDQNFDDLKTKTDKLRTLQLLMDLLPTVEEMKARIETYGTLTGWDKLSPASLGCLRWIISSNRSCILQIDEGSEVPASREPRVPGFPQWIQFRFASGSPDKEQRFVDALRTETANPQHPSLFAWHGSSLGNWHSIIRQGLHFKETINGRAFGHGCYHGKDFATSNGYSARGGSTWPKSMLEISTAVALSEIVNAPAKFVSQQPHYVVQFLDWIQTRYLFVQPRATVSVQEDLATQTAVLPQDPARTPTNFTHQPLVLPITAVPKSRRPRLAGATRVVEVIDIDDDTMSVATLDEDRLALEEPEMPLPIIPAKRQADTSVMPFNPIELKDLPLTAPPTYASAMTTRRLQKDFQALLATQEAHEQSGCLSELGWYVDPAQFVETANLYQWIIELHSFDLQLPLAKDMQTAKVQSVILEMRFHSTYPMGPPFVRVIRPRFLPFQQGGGGHVTAGGSICMDLLTNSGWSAVSSIESVLLQIRMAISSTDPRPARLENPRAVLGNRDYGVGEAVEAFKRACAVHGWQVPKELKDVAGV